MAIPLRQSTASQEVPLGPFLSTADGDTEMTSLTIANTDIKLHIAGATSLASKNSGGATHMANGVYYCVLDATDTATVGPLVIFIHVATALAIKVECVVLPGPVYDSLVAGTDALQVHANEITAGLITSTAIAASGANKIADHTIRRTFQNACDSADGDTKTFRSLLGAIAKLVNKIGPSGSNLQVFEDDDTTVLGTQAITTDAGANPITVLDTN